MSKCNGNWKRLVMSSLLTCADRKALICRQSWKRDWRLHVQLELARRDPWFFLTRFCITLDSHDPQRPKKPFPDRPYLRELTNLWLRHPLLVIAKSRQMLATWLMVGLYLWDTMMLTGRLTFLQSKREEDAVGNHTAATGLLGRARFILEHLHPALTVKYRATANKIEFPSRNSTLWAVPQGPDIIRQHTASGILSDEMAFQYQAEDAYTAAIPTIENGGRFTALSTAHPGFFQRLYMDQLSNES